MQDFGDTLREGDHSIDGNTSRVYILFYDPYSTSDTAGGGEPTVKEVPELRGEWLCRVLLHVGNYLLDHSAAGVLVVDHPVGEGRMVLTEILVEPNLNMVTGCKSDHLVAHGHIPLYVVDCVEAYQGGVYHSQRILKIEPPDFG